MNLLCNRFRLGWAVKTLLFVITSLLLASGPARAQRMAVPWYAGADAYGANSTQGAVSIQAPATLEDQWAEETVKGDGKSEDEQQGPRAAAKHWIARLSVSAIYDDNITLSSNNQKRDLYWSINPTVGYQTGKALQVKFEYSPNILLFNSHNEFNAVDHTATATANWRGEKLTVSAVQSINRLSGPTQDVGDRTKRTVIGTGINAAYALTGRTSLDGFASQYLVDYDDKLDSKTWLVGGYANYNLTPKLKVGVGPAIGFVDMVGPNQTFQEARGRVAYQATEKLGFDAYAGIQFRQYQSPMGAASSADGVFGLSGTWTPRQGTIISLRGYRTFEASATQANQNILITGFGASVNQQFAQRFTASLSGGYEFGDYESTVSGVTAPRQDSYFYLSPSLAMTINNWWSASIFYRYSQNDSDGGPGNFDFMAHQIGLSSTISY